MDFEQVQKSELLLDLQKHDLLIRLPEMILGGLALCVLQGLRQMALERREIGTVGPFFDGHPSKSLDLYPFCNVVSVRPQAVSTRNTGNDNKHHENNIADPQSAT